MQTTFTMTEEKATKVMLIEQWKQELMEDSEKNEGPFFWDGIVSLAQGYMQGMKHMSDKEQQVLNGK